MFGRMRRCEGGAVAVEFALLLPVFLVMMLGIVEYGRAMWTRSIMQFAVEEATRYALADSTLTTSQISSYGKGKLTGVDSSLVTFSTVSDTSAVTVTATMTFSVLGGGLLPTPSLQLSASSRLPRQE